jgi:predicted nucleotidyltransferase
MRQMPSREQIILEGYRGSISHGVYVPDHIDDKDVFGIFIPPKEYLIGLDTWDHYESVEAEWDYLYYSIKKFFDLALRGNPNVLSLLWLEPQFYRVRTSLGMEIVENRGIFTSKESYHNFIGYAHDQMRRMTHLQTKGYMGKKRKELAEKFGYDCKNAAHCIRLLKMGIEFLVDGKLNVWRDTDRDQLLEIKLGKWPLQRVQETAGQLFELAEVAYARSNLPAEPNRKQANELLVSITERAWIVLARKEK